jgi:hypothetical protein
METQQLDISVATLVRGAPHLPTACSIRIRDWPNSPVTKSISVQFVSGMTMMTRMVSSLSTLAIMADGHRDICVNDKQKCAAGARGLFRGPISE